MFLRKEQEKQRQGFKLVKELIDLLIQSQEHHIEIHTIDLLKEVEQLRLLHKEQIDPLHIKGLRHPGVLHLIQDLPDLLAETIQHHQDQQQGAVLHIVHLPLLLGVQHLTQEVPHPEDLLQEEADHLDLEDNEHSKGS